MSERPAGEATEAPSPRRLRDARRRGEVAHSRLFTGALATAATLFALTAALPGFVAELGGFLRSCLVASSTVRDGLPPGGLWVIAGHVIVVGLLPVLAVSLGAAALAGGLQTRGLLSWQPVAPRLDRLDPVRGLGRLLSIDALLSVARALAGAAVVVLVGYLALRSRLGAILAVGRSTPSSGMAASGSILRALLERGALALVVLGALDYLVVRRRFQRRLRMTRDELRREIREEEGDPHHKQARRRAHEEILRVDVARAVRSADCVVVNPDHIAVALRYHRDQMNAPEIVAKGEDLAADEIRRLAREAGVPLLRNVPLARALNLLEVGDEVPEDLYDVVAEILRFVYRLGGQPGSDGADVREPLA